ncbi:MAG: OmpA family protein [Rhizomicrobium sp.]
MRRSISVLMFFASAAMGCAAAQAADLAGSKDPSFLKRFEGSEIVYYETMSYESYNLAGPDTKKNDGSWIFTPVEGQITRIVYHIPSGHTVLELLRNYEDALKDAHLAQTGERRGGTDMARDFANAIFHQSWETNGDFKWSNLGLAGVQQMALATAKGNDNGRAVNVSVLVANYSSPTDVTYKSSVHFDPDQPFVVVDVVASKAVGNKMVLVKAADMADALAKKGVVDLYGIYFDTDKTDVKPESGATLDEVANLLKIDRSLKLEISGHTDNTGAKDHNMKLSQGRAAAVMAVLVGKYGIDAKRLTAKGYGDTKPVAPNDTDANKAKNRRVELRKI